MKDFNKRIHIEISKGTPEQNRIYCSKEGNFIEFGTLTIQGSNKCKKREYKRTNKNSVNHIMKY